MPRVAARQPDGTVLVAYGHAGVIVNENDGPIRVVDPSLIGTVWSKICSGEWEEANEPVPEGFLSPEVIDPMADFERAGEHSADAAALVDSMSFMDRAKALDADAENYAHLLPTHVGWTAPRR